jgi:hypothetical protein
MLHRLRAHRPFGEPKYARIVNWHRDGAAVAGGIVAADMMLARSKQRLIGI